MTHHHRSPDPSPSPTTAAIVPPVIVSLMAAFRDFFTAPVWDHVLVLVTGAILTTGKRTVSAVLRIMGLAEAADFALYHHVLSQAHWDSRVIARKLLSLILERLLPTGPVIIGIDDTIEHRTALGQEDRGARHLPRSGALHPRPFRQGQRPALAFLHGDDSAAVGGTALGLAIPHHPGAVGAS
jgi:DDE superfamily endonuclease